MSTMTAATPRLGGAGHQLRPAQRRAASVRLTSRGRLVLVLLFVALVLALFALVGPNSTALPSDAKLEPVRTVQVQPGQTLWDIARQVAPDQDPRAVVDAIVDLNALTDPGALQVGQRLGIPDLG